MTARGNKAIKTASVKILLWAEKLLLLDLQSKHAVARGQTLDRLHCKTVRLVRLVRVS